MVIPKITDQNILDALKYIDDNGIPDKNKSTKYVLVTEDGRTYPPMYVVAIAVYLSEGGEINTDGYNAVEAKNFFETRGYVVESKQEKFELTITKDSIVSTDERFSLDNITFGDEFKPLETYFQKADGEIIKRNYNRSENRISNQTLPRLACQIYETQIAALSTHDKELFPVCQYTLSSDPICGIFSTVEEIKQKRNTSSYEYSIYSREGGPQFVIYSWNIFSTLLFAQECLKRFGNDGDKFVLSYREKTDKEKGKERIIEDTKADEIPALPLEGPRNPYSKKLKQAKNIIFRGAPGTGKTHLVKEIAADIISDGMFDSFEDLTSEQKQQVEFVQFHPSYDYTDFVEGLRPKMNPDGTMGFELQQGIFYRFVTKARENLENSKKSKETIEQEIIAKEALNEFLASVEFGVDKFQTIKGSEFYIVGIDEKHIDIFIPGNENVKNLSLSIEEIRRLIESGQKFEKISDITKFFGKQFATQRYSYDFAIYKAISEKQAIASTAKVEQEKRKDYIFIIDEINRGEISKILGELFYSIDPGYRGETGSVSTQYANMHDDPNEKFYIPENVYIIGTMNDIDRSVDSFDFAMRRRFRFIEVTAEESSSILENAFKDSAVETEARNRMKSLNDAILEVEDLNENYQIGGAYFLRANEMGFDDLWTDCLEPLLRDYVRGTYNEKESMKKFAKAYGYVAQDEGSADED